MAEIQSNIIATDRNKTAETQNKDELLEKAVTINVQCVLNYILNLIQDIELFGTGEGIPALLT